MALWWENQCGVPEYNSDPVVTYIVKCPVCKALLGRKENDEHVAFHCDECKTVFTWFPGVDKPSAKLDQDIAATCKCFGCRFRRGEVDEEDEKPIKYGCSDSDD